MSLIMAQFIIDWSNFGVRANFGVSVYLQGDETRLYSQSTSMTKASDTTFNMNPLTAEYVDNCPEDNGFRLRGMEMTRLEVFVDAAFAFAVTMLVISFDAMPTSYNEVILAIKNIPAFIVAVIQLVWIWHTHNIWSRRFGLDTTYTVVLSVALLIVVLIYIYPMRIMAGGMFAWFTHDYLPSNFGLITLNELREMFIFLSIGFVCLCVIFVLMYRYAANLKEVLRLNLVELHISRTFQYMWSGAAAVGVVPILLAIYLPEQQVPYSGFGFFLLGPVFFLVSWQRRKSRALL
jgi:hypothetical protein